MVYGYSYIAIYQFCDKARSRNILANNQNLHYLMFKHYLKPLTYALIIAVVAVCSVEDGHAQSTIRAFTGINMQLGNPIHRMKVAGFVREYHSWVYDEGYPSLSGIWEPASPGYPNNKYRWNPSYQTQSLGLRFDDFYQDINALGVEVQTALIQSPPYIVNPDLLPASFQLFDQMEQKPLFAGEDAEDPASYIEHADWLYHFTARYGSNVFSNNKLNQLIAPKLGAVENPLTGMGLVKYIENWNEPNKWWLITTYPSAYFFAEEYAAMTSVDYDGHAQTLSLQNDPDNPGQQISTVGVKNADPNMQFILSGIADLEISYLQDMVAWWQANRPANAAHGQMPFDAINFHHYSNVNQALNSFGIGGISPEQDDLKGDLITVVAYRDQFLPGKELWLTEFGYDTDEISEMRVPANGIGTSDRQEVQGQWIVRAYLEIAAAGFDKAVMYELRDACTGDTCGLYQSSGLVTSIETGEQPKKSWYYLGTYLQVLGEMIFDADLSPCQDTVCTVDCPRVYRFVHPTDPNQWVYAVWSPTVCGKTFNYDINLEGASSAVLVEMQQGSLVGKTSAIAGSSVNIPVSERPVFVVVGQNLNTTPVPCVGNLTVEKTTCGSATISWQNTASAEKVNIWKMDGLVDLGTMPFNVANAILMGEEIPASYQAFSVTGLAPNSNYTIVVWAQDADGRTSDPCGIGVTTSNDICKITVDSNWVFASSNPANPPIELFDEQGIDPICGTPILATSWWGINSVDPAPVSVSIDLQTQYFLDAIYYHDSEGIGQFTIEYANSPNGPWQVIHSELTTPFDKWITLDNFVPPGTPIRFLRFTADANDHAVIGEIILCGTDSGSSGSIPPGPVANLQSVFPSCNAVMLTWEAPLDNDLDHYEISYPGGIVETVPVGASPFTHTVFGLNENSQTEITVRVVDTQGLSSVTTTITVSTLSASECSDDCNNSCDCTICLRESWVFDLTNANGIDPKRLVDEQSTIHPFCGSSAPNPTTEYGENWQFNGVPPASFLLDLQQCHLIHSIAYFDSWGTGTGSVEYLDGDGNWALVQNFTTNLTSQWREIAGLEITARFLRFTKNDNQAKINEIAVCGFPLGCQNCSAPTDPDADNDGVADACDLCPGFDDFADGDMDGIPNGCDISCPNVGQACNDGDACTTGDVVDSNCNCVGIIADSDNDGVCDADDQCPGSDDTEDVNNNGQPDGCEANCNYLTINPIATDAICFATNTGSIELDMPCGGNATSNLALGKTATQSSTTEGPAGKAVDGNTSGNFWGDFSVSSTGWEVNPWWQVDLGEIANITDVEIWNRTDCCATFLNNYYVLVSESPFPSNNLNTLLNTSGVQSYFQNTTTGTPSTIGINATGRYVRIQISTATLLFLAEVKVFGQSSSNCTFNYQWTGGLGNVANPQGLFAGNYGVTVTNQEDGCTANTIVMVSQPANLICSATEIQAISSFGGSDGKATASTNGGVSPYSFLWSNGQTSATAQNLIAGTYQITTTDANGCTRSAEITLLNPVVNCNEGDPCNDNNTCTINDVFDANCQCAGTFADDDNDGICDNDDACPGSDDSLDDDNDGIPNGCDPCDNNLTGTACTDGDPCTENDVIDANCNCAGTFADDDNDGVCNANDLCPGFDDSLDNDNDGTPDGCDPDSQCGGFAISLEPTNESCFQENDGAIALTPPCVSTNGGGGTGVNLALNQPATQSSTNWIAEAGLACDGNTSGNFWADFSVSETSWGAQPWWQVDLGAVKNISEIEIWNRTDCCTFNLNNYYLLLSDSPFPPNNLSVLLTQNGVTALHQDTQASSPSIIPVNTTGRYVRVQLAGQAILALAEVVVKEDSGTPDPTCDLQYLWSNGATTQNLKGIAPGNYAVTLTNQADGCVATAATTVLAAPAFSCNLQVLQTVSTPGVNNGSLQITATGGSQPLLYQWSNGQTNLLLTNLPPGSYSVTVTDNHGCQCSQSAQLANPGTPPTGYCNSQGQEHWVEYIANVQFAGIDNGSFKELYGDFTNLSASVQQGSSHPILLTAGYSWLSYDEHWSVWIDFNQDSDFEDAGELVLQQNSNDPISVTISIPASATPGTTRMRVAMQRDAFVGPCEIFSQGEVEDYSIFISAPAANPLVAANKLEFDAVNLGREIALYWFTNLDDRTEKYLVEHSTDGIDFQPIGSFLPKTGGHGMEVYETAHQPSTPGIQFYRLRQMALAGNGISQAKEVEFLLDLGELSIFPNPANDVLFVNALSFGGLRGKVQVSSAMGRILIEKEMDEIPFEPMAIEVQQLKDGLYFVAVEADGWKRKVMRVVICR